MFQNACITPHSWNEDDLVRCTTSSNMDGTSTAALAFKLAENPATKKESFFHSFEIVLIHGFYVLMSWIWIVGRAVSCCLYT